VSGNDPQALDRLISAEQDERRRLALFLHDGPVQNLAGIALMLDGALHSLSADSLDEARSIIEVALAQQRATIRELRDLSFVLEPVVLRDHGFGPALRALADQASAAHSIEVDLDMDSATVIGATASVAVYTILRELVDQAIRRGPPGAMRISVAPTPDGGLVASVADNADPERRRRSLEAIEERVRALHGTVAVHASSGGTTIEVTVAPHTARR
jgi:two-component system NarL family sensor kinase